MKTAQLSFKRTVFMVAGLMFWCLHAVSAVSIQLYSAFTKISVPPGESLNYSVEVINKDSLIKTCDLYLTNFPRNWEYKFVANNWTISQIAVLPGQTKTITLQVNVPYAVNKGNYTFNVEAGGLAVLPLTVNVTQKGTMESEFTVDQASMQGTASSNFTYRAHLKNQTGEKQLFALSTNVAPGWEVVFKPNYQQATSVEIDPNQSKDISIEIKPPHAVTAGKYSIPVEATTGTTHAHLELEVEITGRFSLELTTPTGLLSSSITAGNEKQVDLLVKNTGSSFLENIHVTVSKPQGWEVKFKPDTISFLKAGENAVVVATMKAYEKAIPGDYVVNLTAQTPEAISKMAMRLSVKTSLLWGWMGILIIAATIGVIVFLFRKYGRR